MADDPDIVVSGKSKKRDPNELYLTVNQVEASGWEEIEVTLRCEGFPNAFQIAMSSKEPITSKAVVAKAGDACRISLGDDVIITGYIDRDIPGVAAETHRIELVGRGKTQDLVDCSAEWDGALINGTSVLDVATKLALPYALAVNLAEGTPPGDAPPPISITYTDTAADIIQQLAQNAGMLAYEAGDGSLILSAVGAVTAASGAVYGQNVEACTVQNTMDERYSDIVCCSEAQAALDDLAGSDFFHIEKDPNVPRHRRLNIVLERVATDPQAFTILKAKWQIARRAGRASMVHVTVDSWRDKDKKLWAPNTLVPIDVPGMRVADNNLCVSEVTFRRSNATGTTADLVLMPKEAFVPEPIQLLPVNTSDLNPAPAQ